MLSFCIPSGVTVADRSLRKMQPLGMLGLLAAVEGGHWAVVAHDAGPNLAALTLGIQQ